MKPDISEFSYGYAVTAELVSLFGASLVGAPVFPSLIEEGKKGGGYDVKIPAFGFAVFLQFKLSDYLSRSNSKEAKNGVLSLPYFRMHLRPLKHSLQHNLLLDLEKSGEAVFYIAPEFHQPKDLNRYFLSKTIIGHSAAFKPGDIGILPDLDDHYVVFEPGAQRGFLCSEEPIPVVRSRLDGGIEAALREQGFRPKRLGADGLREIAENMVSTIERCTAYHHPRRAIENPRDVLALSGSTIMKVVESVAQPQIEPREILERRSATDSAAYLARVYFGSELLLIEAVENDSPGQ